MLSYQQIISESCLDSSQLPLHFETIADDFNCGPVGIKALSLPWLMCKQIKRGRERRSVTSIAIELLLQLVQLGSNAIVFMYVEIKISFSRFGYPAPPYLGISCACNLTFCPWRPWTTNATLAFDYKNLNVELIGNNPLTRSLTVNSFLFISSLFCVSLFPPFFAEWKTFVGLPVRVLHRSPIFCICGFMLSNRPLIQRFPFYTPPFGIVAVAVSMHHPWGTCCVVLVLLRVGVNVCEGVFASLNRTLL